MLGVGSLAQAGPVADVFAPHLLLIRAHSARPLMLRLQVVPIAASRLQRQPLPLDEPRPTPANSRDLSPAAAADRSAGEQPRPGFAIQWRESREIVNADIVSLVRNYRRDGLPIVHLWQSDQNRLAIGLNSHGLPGIYFTRHVGG